MRYPVTTTGPTGSGLVEGRALRPHRLPVKHVFIGTVGTWIASRGVERSSAAPPPIVARVDQRLAHAPSSIAIFSLRARHPEAHVALGAEKLV